MIEPHAVPRIEPLLERPPRQPLTEEPAGRSRAELLEERIVSRTATLSVVGLGYVGLPLGLTFGDAGFPVSGVDVAASKVEALRRDRSHVTDVPDDELLTAIATRRLVPTTDWSVFESRLLEPGFVSGRDLVIVVTDHSSFEYGAIAAAAPLILDTRNALAELGAAHVRKL